MCGPGSPHCQALTPAAAYGIRSPVMHNTWGVLRVCVAGGGGPVVALWSCILAECLVPWGHRPGGSQQQKCLPEARSPKSRCRHVLLPRKVPRKELPCLLVSGGGRRPSVSVASGGITLIAASVVTWPLPCVPPRVSVHTPPTFSVIRTTDVGLRAHPGPVEIHWNWIASIKTQIKSRVPLVRTGPCLLRGHNSTHDDERPPGGGVAPWEARPSPGVALCE